MDNYTQLLTDVIDEEEITEENILAFLNNENQDYLFKTFPELLRRFVSKVSEVEEGKTLDYVKIKSKEKNIPFNRNTLNNWFTKTGPKKSDEARKMLYKLAFTLELDIDQTAELFKVVYKDRPFNVRRIFEFVYYICIKNRIEYSISEEIIREAKTLDLTTESGHTVHTKKILSEIDQIINAEEIIPYIQTHTGDFCTNNESAKQILNGLIYDIKIKPEEAELINKGLINETNSIMSQELQSLKAVDEDYLKNSVKSSTDTMLTIIYGENFRKVKSNAGRSVLKDSKLPADIKNRLPDNHTFSKKEPSYEELRKMIILLASYKFWYVNRHETYAYDFEEYQIEINSYLEDANMPSLYLGNPFDWMFVYCSSLKMFQNIDPLDAFREIISDSIYADNN